MKFQDILPKPPQELLRLEKDYPTINLPKPEASALRVAVRGMPTFILQDAYCKLQSADKDNVVPFEGPMLHFRDAVKEVLFERGKLPKSCG